MSDRYWIMASQIKCGSCDSALGRSGRGLGGGGGGGFFRVAYYKIPRQVDVEMCVF